MADAHPDITILKTDRVVINIDEVRNVVSRASLATSIGKYRIIIIEDADRMAERTSNVLLKVLEEPEANTIWILCAPSVSDLLPTIRSRTRNLNLRLPSVAEVTALIMQRDGVEESLARRAALQAQNHVGMARRLASSSEARARRQETLRVTLSIGNLSQAMLAAEKLLGVAKRDAEAVAQERDDKERLALMRAYGLEESEKVPTNLRAQFKEIEENQKRRQTRALRDGIDRIFTDLESLYRDIIAIQLGGEQELVNQEVQQEIFDIAQGTKAKDTIEVLDAITKSRARLASNVRDLLVLESLCVQMIFRGKIAN
jgi:DNA polymerase-3 subunit delta'